ncbi:MAG: hypothetical protein HFF32_07690 [Flavonifractor sp.]|nr:hypothetical protein [Flavonifractor sp.]
MERQGVHRNPKTVLRVMKKWSAFRNTQTKKVGSDGTAGPQI